MNYSLNLNLEGAAKIDATLDRLLDKVGKVGSGQKLSFDDWLSHDPLGGGGSGGGKPFSGPKPPRLDDLNKKLEKDMASFGKNISMLSGPMMNPSSPLMTMFAGRQVFSALTTQTGQGMLGKFGLGGNMGAAIGATALIGAATAIGVAFIALKKIVSETIATFEHARQLYAKSLTSGLGLGFTVQRSQLASVMGVSEMEVIKFGAAMAYLKPQLENSSYYLSKTTTNLTSVSWEFKVLGENLKSLFAVMANDAAPALRKFADGMSTVIKTATKMIDKSSQFASEHPTASLAARTGLSLSAWLVSPSAGLASLVIKGISLLGKDRGAASTPQSFMNQMPASNWEKMGLAIGGGGQGTNDLIRKSNQYLKVIAHHVALPRSGNGQFGMSPTVGNP